MIDLKKYIPFVLVLLSASSFAQKKLSKQDIELNKLDCKKVQKFSEESRLKLFPYNIADQVMLISFDDAGVGKMQGTELQKFLDDNLNKVLDDSQLSRITEKQILSKAQTSELTNIIYNYTFTKPPTIMPVAKCYMPSNAILYLDKNNKLLGFMELCFLCERYRESNEKITIGDDCTQKMDMLKAFFQKSGIIYGTVEKRY
ncbi:hypothetical protein [Soonwooa sp.]|uniref:hypothetical protein n=1 Tax=Soonwooa sp. TaxID=1938592 RepID=UPI00263625C7|nr:hypothetical protein [Soonwooa sp.]